MQAHLLENFIEELDQSSPAAQSFTGHYSPSAKLEPSELELLKEILWFMANLAN